MTMKNVCRLFLAVFFISCLMSSSVLATESGQSELDIEKPTLTASINNGVINIQGADTGSGVASIYVNNHEYTDLNKESLAIRLQQYDSGYEYFYLKAKDHAGNVSAVYKLANPYYIKENLEGDEKELALAMKASLPFSGIPTSPTDAKGTITEHTQMVSTQTEGTTTVTNLVTDAAVPEFPKVETEVVKTTEGAGKEFYTIQTQSDKVFYLIIDKSKEENNVYLLTEVSENDLLNFTENNSEVLPQNSVVLDAAVPGNNTIAVNDGTKSEPSINENSEKEGALSGDESTQVTDTGSESKKLSNLGSYLMIGVVVLVVGGVGVYQKLIKGKKDNYDVDEDEEYEDEYENEETNDTDENEDESQ